MKRKIHNREKLGVLTRSMTFNRDAVDEENRTVSLAFSSEDPYERWWGIEILSHEKGAVKLDRLTNKAPLLIDHDMRNQAGVVESATIGADKFGRAEVRFSKNKKSDEVFQDVLDGIRTKVSVGYTIKKMKLEESSEDGPDVYRVTEWEPYEISIVSIAADDTVGVGRNAEVNIETIIETEEVKEMKDEKKPEDGNEHRTVVEVRTPETPPVDIDKIKADAMKDAKREESTRVAEIFAIGERNGLIDIAKEAIADGTPLAEFRQKALDALVPKEGKGTDVAPPADTDLGMNEKEKRSYSIMKAIEAAATNDWSDAGLELEASRALQKKLNRSPNGFFVPNEALVVEQRDLTVGTATAGGNLVETDLRSGDFIDILRNRMVVRQLGATVLDGLVGDVAIPRQTGAGTGYWLAEGDDATESQQSFDQVTLTPRTVAGTTEMTRKLRQQSSISVENLVRNDLAAVIARAIDLAAINGSGASNQPTGIMNTTGIGSVAIGTDGGPLTWSATVALETEISVDNADVGTMAYLTNPNVRGAAKTIEKASGTAQFLWEGTGSMNGYKAAVTNQVPSNLTKGAGTNLSALILGVWDQLLIGVWGGLDILVNPYTGSKSGKLEITVFHDCDIAVRHPESFAMINDISTNQ